MLRAAVVCVALVCSADAALSCRDMNQKINDIPKLPVGPFDCNPDGSYSAKQCLGTECYCMAADGRILGYITPTNETAHQTCRCARDKDNYEQKHLIGLLFMCSDDGSYRPYRCEGSVCFCVDSHGKKRANSVSMKIGDLDSLKC